MSQTDFQKAERLSIYSGNCIRRLSPIVSCEYCETLCPEGALTFADDRWHAINCSLCGLCAMVCPTQVFQIDQHRVIQHQKGEPLSLCCAQNRMAPANALRLNCLQQFSPLSLIYLLYHHPKLTFYLSPEQCKKCRHGWYAEGLIQQLEQYQIPESKLKIVLQTPEPADSAIPMQRRDLFRDLFQRTEKHSRKAVVQAVEKLTAGFSSAEVSVEATELFPVRLPLYALYVKKQLPLHPEAELPFRRMICTACSFCGACTHICPTQALAITESELESPKLEKQLRFQPELCINCGLCQAVCMQKGLAWDEFFTQAQFLDSPQILAHSREKICTECEHDYYQWPETDDTLCSFCRR